MTDPGAASLPGRPPMVGTAVLVVAFVFLAPPLFLLVPLALLLIFSRPRTGREWLWLALTLAGTARLLGDFDPPSLPARIISSGAIMMGAVFTLLALAWKAPTLERALVAVAVTAAGVVGWCSASGITIAELDTVIVADLRRSLEVWLTDAPADQRTGAMATAPAVARVFPGLLALQALAGLGLAWRWYHRIAAQPLGPVPGPLATFRFNDHLIWGAIFTLGLVLVPLGDLINRVAGSALVTWVGLYATRGAAIVATAARGWPLPGKILMLVLSFLALPIALGTMVSLGVADTWLDFRNRAVPNAGGGNADGSDSP